MIDERFTTKGNNSDHNYNFPERFELLIAAELLESIELLPTDDFLVFF